MVRRVLDALPGLVLQPKTNQSRFKISYYIDPDKAPSLEDINQLLHQEEQSVNVILSFGQFLDVLPIRASKGLALRYMATSWDIPLEQILVAGGSGADEDMMRGNTLAVVVGNRHHEELSQLEDVERIYFAAAPRGGRHSRGAGPLRLFSAAATSRGKVTGDDNPSPAAIYRSGPDPAAQRSAAGIALGPRAFCCARLPPRG